MSQLPPPPPPPPSGRGQGGAQGPNRQPGRARSGPGLPRWSVWVLLAVLLGVLLLSPLLSTDNRPQLGYTDFVERVEKGDVKSVTVNNETGTITGEFENGEKFATAGPIELTESDRALLREHDVEVDFRTPQSSWLG